MTIPNESIDGASKNLFTWQNLHSAKAAFDVPFKLRLQDGQIFHAERVLRVMPQKRMVVFGSWANKPVVAKLFYDPQQARRHMEKDMAGVKILLDSNIPTPELYYEGVSEDRRVFILIYERIFSECSLEDTWRKRTSIEELLPILQTAVIELATQHVLGVRQRDLHLKNFLMVGKIIYTLDGGQVESYQQILPKEPSMHSLALFLSQLGVGLEHVQERLFRFYAKSRGWIIKKGDLTELFLLIREWNASRWKSFAKKVFRESTEFAGIWEKKAVGILDRAYEGDELRQFLKNPDAIFQRSSTVMLKAGNSSTVIKVTLDNREYVVKRYNIKNTWHSLRRCIRETRAAKSWLLAQKLNLFGVETAKPVAYFENRFLGLRGKSYYITEYVHGEQAGTYFKQIRRDEYKTNLLVERIAILLKNLRKLEITHGDLKSTNILISETDQPLLIDLDGANEHFSLNSLRSAWGKEIQRFLENFADQPSLAEKFKQAFAIYK